MADSITDKDDAAAQKAYADAAAANAETRNGSVARDAALSR